MRLGIVGLPNVGKSSLFNALTQARADVGEYPFTTIDRNIGVVPVPDARVEQLAELANSESAFPTTIEFVDIAGIVRGASRGEGLGNQFLAHIREMDALVNVVRCFESSHAAHVEGSVHPLRDVDTIDIELALADLATLGKAMQRTERLLKTGREEYRRQWDFLSALAGHLDQGRPARTFPLTDEQCEYLADLHLLTMKPTIYAVNLGEADFRELMALRDIRSDGMPQAAGDTASGDARLLATMDNPALRELAEAVTNRGESLVAFSARLEAELAELDEATRAEFLADLGMNESALNRLIHEGYRLLGLITFFTANQKEARARTLVHGSTAWEAAGKVHSDMQHGFVKAEVISVDKLLRVGSFAAARERGLIGIEGRDYVVRDGDVLYFRFT